MQIVDEQMNSDLATMLNGYEYPAILVSSDYRILAANDLYLESFGAIQTAESAFCYNVSHGYNVPCDQAGEDCPLAKAQKSLRKERVLHVHQTPRGKEHVDVEMLPILDENGSLKYFVELLKPVNLASAQIDRNKMVGNSKQFNAMVEKITRVGPSDASVILLGESGTGKELAALAIHQASEYKDKAMVTLECSGLTETLFESELFGHVKGSFTGATHNKPGLVEAANGGTLFLDEIGDVALDLQVKLLRLLETGIYRPVGSNETKRTNFRLICATHKDIFKLVKKGDFRRDLFFRINVFPIYLPNLNERMDDIQVLAKTILARLDKTDKFILTDSAVAALKKHDYTGNIRELRNIISRALVLTNTHIIDQHVVKKCIEIDNYFQKDRLSLNDLKSNEQDYLTRLLKYCDGNKEKAAKIANISLRSLYRKLQFSQHDNS